MNISFQVFVVIALLFIIGLLVYPFVYHQVNGFSTIELKREERSVIIISHSGWYRSWGNNSSPKEFLDSRKKKVLFLNDSTVKVSPIESEVEGNSIVIELNNYFGDRGGFYQTTLK